MMQNNNTNINNNNTNINLNNNANNNNNNANSNNNNVDNKIKEEKKKAWGQLVAINAKVPNFELIEDEISIGRGTKCSLKIGDVHISSLHCKIYRENNLVWIEDFSSNGTFLNGRKVPFPPPLIIIIFYL